MWQLSGNPQLPKIKFSVQEEYAEINSTGRVLELKSGKLKLADQSAAKELAVPGKTYRWTPSELTSRATGGADLYSAHLTADNSALVIAERIGGNGDVHGTRLIVCETASGKVVRASKVFPLRPVASKVMDDNTFVTLALAPADESSSSFFAVIDIADEKLSVKKKFSSVPQAAAISDKFAAILQSSGKIDVYNTSDFSPAASKEFGRELTGIIFSNDGRELAVFGKEKIIILNAETLYRKAEYKLSQANFTCCTVPGKSGFEHAVFYSVGGDACVLINNNLIKLDITPGGTAVSDTKSGKVIIENRIRELEIFQFPDLVPTGKYSPGKMRPASRNEMFSILVTTGKEQHVLLVDHRGNIWKVEFKGKRGRKLPLLIVDNTGVRQSK